MRATKLARDRYMFVTLVIYRMLNKLKVFVNTEQCKAFVKRIVDKALERFDYDEKFCNNAQNMDDVTQSLADKMRRHFGELSLLFIIEHQDPIEDLIAEWLQIETRQVFNVDRKMKTGKRFLLEMVCGFCLVVLYMLFVIFCV